MISFIALKLVISLAASGEDSLGRTTAGTGSSAGGTSNSGT